MENGKFDILYVDDDPDIRAIVELSLELDLRFKVRGAASAAEALAAVRNHMPDALLLDVSMPDVDGPELLTRLRAAGCSSPVVFLTAHARPAEHRHLQNLDARAILTKPFDPLVLAAQVRSILGLQ